MTACREVVEGSAKVEVDLAGSHSRLALGTESP